MNSKTEDAVALLALLLVLLGTLRDPRVSVGVAIVALAALGLYEFTRSKA